MIKKLLLPILLCLISVVSVHAKTDDSKLKTVFIATWTNDPVGIYSCLYDQQTGELSDIRKEVTAVQSSFMAFSQDKKYLYSFRTEKDGFATFLSFRIEADKRTLTPVDSLPTGTVDPCHVKIINKGKTLAAACYADGKVIYCNVTKDGKFVGAVQVIDHNLIQPNPQNKKSHAHQINVDNKEKFVYITDLGLDLVVVYKIENDKLVNVPVSIKTTSGAGPRHTDFDPSGKYMALICEHNSTVVLYGKDGKGIFSDELQVISTVPEGYTGRKSGADIHFSPDGKTLFASERGNHSVAIYNVGKTDKETDKPTDKLTWAGSITDNIKTPRNFAVDKNGKWLIVGNQDGGNVATYRAVPDVNPVSKVTAIKPSCILILD